MSKRFYPVILAAISESHVNMKIIRDIYEYEFFISRSRDPGTEIKEIKTPESIYLERMSKFYPNITGWSQWNIVKMDVGEKQHNAT
jgi:hypothetical protein